MSAAFSRLGLMTLRCIASIFAAWSMMLSLATVARSADEIKSFWEIGSGHYGLAYGTSDSRTTKLEGLKLVLPPDDEAFQNDFLRKFEEYGAAHGVDPKDPKNYLVDLRTHRAIAVISGFSYSPIRSHCQFEDAWSPNGKEDFVMIEDRYNTSMAWLEPQKKRAQNVTKDIERAFRGALLKREGQHCLDDVRYCLTFAEPKWRGSRRLILGADATVPKDAEKKSFDYRLEFLWVKRRGQMHLALISAKREFVGY
ncbi:MAG TPA: hypothetical protein VK961_17330 [Chthoniobacter sp.]|nr:hypothetical protein [Chthoniobacter sp.]